MTSLTQRKAACREKLKVLRNSLKTSDRQRYNESICERLLSLPQIREARVIFMFLSHGTEVDIRQCLEELLRSGKSIAVPVIIDRETMIAVPFDSWDSLQPGQLGILTPTGRTPITDPVDVCITPGLGFSPLGQRLGYGRGYYDRWFRANPLPLKIAPSYECQLLEDLPYGETDVPVDMIVTESRIIRISPSSSAEYE